jgi:hypothetical protein
MTQEHPITPPPELVRQWFDDTDGILDEFAQAFATKAARWGADQELMACVNWLYENGWGQALDGLRDARRPKPPSLKEQALIALETWAEDKYGIHKGLEVGLIRRALEQLDD